MSACAKRNPAKPGVLTCMVGVGRFILQPLHRITADPCLEICGIGARWSPWWLRLRRTGQDLQSPTAPRTHLQTCTDKHNTGEMTNNMEAVQGVTFGPALGEQCLFSSVLISSTYLPLMRLLQMEDLAVQVVLQNPFFFPLDFENFA